MAESTKDETLNKTIIASRAGEADAIITRVG